MNDDDDDYVYLYILSENYVRSSLSMFIYLQLIGCGIFAQLLLLT